MNQHRYNNFVAKATAAATAAAAEPGAGAAAVAAAVAERPVRQAPYAGPERRNSLSSLSPSPLPKAAKDYAARVRAETLTAAAQSAGAKTKKQKALDWQRGITEDRVDSSVAFASPLISAIYSPGSSFSRVPTNTPSSEVSGSPGTPSPASIFSRSVEASGTPGTPNLGLTAVYQARRQDPAKILTFLED